MTHPADTSAAAGASIVPHLERLEALVVACIRARGSACCDEVEADSGLSHQTTSARITTLAKRGILVATGETRRTRSGRRACAWRVAL